MAIYTFRLRDGRGDVEDATGVELPDRDRAFRYANAVVHKLMRSRELETRSWRLEIYEGGDDRPICEIPFASVDPSLDHLTPKLRTPGSSHAQTPDHGGIDIRTQTSA